VGAPCGRSVTPMLRGLPEMTGTPAPAHDTMHDRITEVAGLPAAHEANPARQ
jgi:hypothetical protein